MTSVRPSQTRRGEAWLSNFGESERRSAQLLLDSIQIANPTQVHHALIAQIRSLEPLLNGNTGVLIPAVSIEDVDKAIEGGYHHAVAREAAIAANGPSVTMPRWPAVGRHIAYETFNPGAPIPATPGSEGAIGNLVRSLTGDAPGREPSVWLHPATDLEALSVRRCRLILLVTDYSGSGQQAVRFAATFSRQARLRSWRSFGWLKIVVVAYAAALTARAAVSDSRYVDDMVVHTPATSFDDAAWTPDERAEIEQLCRRYTPHHARRQSLGYGGSGGLFVTHTSVPNNLPYILRRNTRGWHSFFEGRTVPSDLAAELAHYESPDRDLAAVAREVNQARISQALASGRLTTTGGRLAAILALIAHSHQTAASITHQLAIPDSDTAALVAFLQQVGFVTNDLTITGAGRVELAHARRLDRTSSAHLPRSDEPYYPQSLR